MKKKNFNIDDNPALMFISSAEEQEEQKEQKEQQPTEGAETIPTTAKAPDGYKLNPMYVETKTKRLQLILQPSLMARVKAEANNQGLSVNEFCHRVLDQATRKDKE